MGSIYKGTSDNQQCERCRYWFNVLILTTNGKWCSGCVN